MSRKPSRFSDNSVATYHKSKPKHCPICGCGLLATPECCDSNTVGIRSINDVDDFPSFAAGRRGWRYAPGLEAIQAGLMKHFLESLRAEEKELCRRVAIAIRPFKKKLAKDLWSLDFPELDFPATWNDCILKAFESLPSARYALPELYQLGLQDFSSAAEKEKWHATAADVLAAPDGRHIEAFDLRDAILHRLLSGQISRAVGDAAMFLFVPARSKDKTAKQFLFSQFSVRFSRLNVSAVEKSAWIKWLAVEVQMFRELSDSTKLERAVDRLHLLLTSIPHADAVSERLGWSILLSHAALTGDVEKATLAVKHVIIELDSEKGGVAWPQLSVVSAFATAERDPLPYLQTLFGSADRHGLKLWHRRTGFDFWKSVGIALCRMLDQTYRTDKVMIGKTYDQLIELATKAAERDEMEIALILRTTATHIQIDFGRDFTAASTTALGTLDLLQTTDQRLIAHCHHTLGNALRAPANTPTQRLRIAKPLVFGQSHAGQRLAESTVMLSICVGRQGQSKQA